MQIEMILDDRQIRAEASWDSGQRGDGRGSASEQEEIAAGWECLRVWAKAKFSEKVDIEIDITDEITDWQRDRIFAEMGSCADSEQAEAEAYRKERD